MEGAYLIDLNNNNTSAGSANTLLAPDKPISTQHHQVALAASNSNGASSLSSGRESSNSSLSAGSNSSTNSLNGSSTNLDQDKHQDQRQLTGREQVKATDSLLLEQLVVVAQPKPRGRRKKIRTEPIRPICPQCEKQFSNQSALTKHKLTHSDERKFACQQCSKAFKRHDHLTGHMQTHSNRKPFNCTIHGCDKTYCDARSLRRHKENIHHIVTPKENQNNRQHQHQHLNQQHHQQQNQQQHQQQHQQHYHHQQQASYSADYASSQHFSFDFNHTNHIDQTFNSNRVPSQSSDSIADSGLGSNLHYEQQTPTSLHPNQHAGYSTPISLHPSTPLVQSLPSATHIADGVSAEEQSHQMSSQATGQNYLNSSGSAVASSTQEPPRQAVQIFNVNEQQQQPIYHNQQQQTNFNTLPSSATQQPSHLLRRRIQRLHSDSSAVYTNDQPSRLDLPRRTSMDPSLNLHQQQQQLHLNQQQQYHHQQQASYSADYASTQHFSFDFNHSTHMDPPFSSNSIPSQSSDSITDSGLGLNLHYEQQINTPTSLHPNQHTLDHHHAGYSTPISLHPQTPLATSLPPSSATHSADSVSTDDLNRRSHQMNSPVTDQNYLNSSGSAVASSTGEPSRQAVQIFNINEQQQQQPQPIYHSHQQQTNFNNLPSSAAQQPSHLLRRRIQRLHSDSSAIYADEQPSRLDLPRRTSMDPGLGSHHQQLHQHQHQQQHYHHQQQVSYSADYASTQHFSFDFNHTTHMDPPFSSNSIPSQSSDSITDSALGLNLHYEQQINTPTSLHPNQHTLDHHHAGYSTPISLHPQTPLATSLPPPSTAQSQLHNFN